MAASLSRGRWIKGMVFLSSQSIDHQLQPNMTSLCYHLLPRIDRNVTNFPGNFELWSQWLTHWGRVTHICVGTNTNIGPDNGLAPGRRQAIIWTNAGILLIGPLGTNFSRILSEIHTFSFKKMHFKNIVCEVADILSRPQCVKKNNSRDLNY